MWVNRTMYNRVACGRHSDDASTSAPTRRTACPLSGSTSSRCALASPFAFAPRLAQPVCLRLQVSSHFYGGDPDDIDIINGDPLEFCKLYTQVALPAVYILLGKKLGAE